MTRTTHAHQTASLQGAQQLFKKVIGARAAGSSGNTAGLTSAAKLTSTARLTSAANKIHAPSARSQPKQQATQAGKDGAVIKASGRRTNVEPYDCQMELDTWQVSFSPEKRRWCCKYKGLACKLLPNVDANVAAAAQELKRKQAPARHNIDSSVPQRGVVSKYGEDYILHTTPHTTFCMTEEQEGQLLWAATMLTGLVAGLLLCFLALRRSGSRMDEVTSFKCRIISENKVAVLSEPTESAEVVCYLEPKEVFSARDRVFLSGEGRAYFQLAGGSGWVPECSRKNINRPVVAIGAVPKLVQERPAPSHYRRRSVFAGPGGPLEDDDDAD